MAPRPCHSRASSASPRACRAANARSSAARRSPDAPPGAAPPMRREEVDRGGRGDDALVILRAGLEPLGRVVGRRLQLGRVERVDQRRAGRRGRRGAGRRTCRRSRPGSRSRARRRRPGRAARSARHRRRSAPAPSSPAPTARATSLIVPSAFEAAPIATSFVCGVICRAKSSQSSSRRAGSNFTARIVSPRSLAAARQGSTLA